MYQVLYRKWRPHVFSDVVGQVHVTDTLRHELEAGRTAHAYLFTGSRGTGKTTCAKILAKAVNCLHPKNGDPCCECEICRGIDNGSVLDVVEIDAASNNGVDNIRSLREEANFTPAAACCRVYIIDEVHMLSVGAFNALLKTLEEPPAHVLFVLATTEVHKLPATILSRCQRFDFRRIAPADIAARLTYVAEQENAFLEPAAAIALARLADGALRDALSLLDQCLGQSRQVTVSVVNETAGLAGAGHLFSLADAVHNRDSAAALQLLDELYGASKDMARLCEELAGHFRSLMLIKTMKNARAMVLVSDEEYEHLTKQALAAPLPELLHGMDALQGALERMYRGGNRRMELEMALIRLCAPELDATSDALIRRVETLERALKQGVRAVAPAEHSKPRTEKAPPQAMPAPSAVSEFSDADAPPPEPPPEPAPFVPAYPPPSPEPEKDGAPHRLAEWPEILTLLKEYSATIWAAFRGSSAYVQGEYVLIDAKEMAFELLRRSAAQRNKMREAIRQATGRTYKLGPYKPAQKKVEEDPLSALASRAKSEGIPVEEN